ncbi:MAG TPA: phage portal protein, partial [Chloroflexia bacterium]|nr:phage portal protein [Chloroflexia bacterium]
MAKNLAGLASTGTQPGHARPTLLSHEDAQRVAAYKLYLDFYNGYQWDGLPAPNEKRLTFNYARVFVHKAASYLMGKGVSFAVTPPDGSGDEGKRAAQHAEALLQACYERNSLALVDLDTAVDSAVLGDGAFKVTWDAQAGAPSISAVDPATLCCVRQADDYRRLLKVTQTYYVGYGDWVMGVGSNYQSPTPNPHHLSPTTHPPAQQVVEEWTAETLEVWRDGELEKRVPNPYGAIPYIVFPNLRVPKEPWGQSDLVDVMQVNRDLNSRLSILSHILEVSGNPIAVLENVTDSTGIKVGPGRLWELPKDAKAYLLDLLSGGGVGLHIEYINLLYRAMHDLAEMPRTAFGDGEGTSRSGVALEIELQPMLQKVARKRAIWQVALEERCRMTLRLHALHGDEHAGTVVDPTRGY